MLTAKQKELLIYLNSTITDTGFCPSFEEMRTAMGLQSKSGIHRLITALEERGFIRKLPNRARAIEILKSPDYAKENLKPRQSLSTLAKKPRRHKEDLLSPYLHQNVVEIPLYGKIAAGSPLEALREPVSYIQIPETSIGHGRHYALTIDGDSMCGIGIMNGDTAIIRHTSNAKNGEIIVALVDDNEVTLKKIFYNDADKTIALEPANKDYDTQIYETERVQIQGTLVGIQRIYD
jgi:repressor LexA